MSYIIEAGNLLANLPSLELFHNGHQANVQGRAQPNIFWLVSGQNNFGVFKSSIQRLSAGKQGYNGLLSGDSSAAGLLNICGSRTGVVHVDDVTEHSPAENPKFIRSNTSGAKREVRSSAANGGVRKANTAVIATSSNHTPQHLMAAEVSRTVLIDVPKQTGYCCPESHAEYSSFIASNGPAGTLASAASTPLMYLAWAGGSAMIDGMRGMLLEILKVAPSRQIDNYSAIGGRLIEFCALTQIPIDFVFEALATLTASLHSKLHGARANTSLLALFIQGITAAQGQNKVGGGVALWKTVDMHNFLQFHHVIHGDIVVCAYVLLCTKVFPSVGIKMTPNEIEKAFVEEGYEITHKKFMKVKYVNNDVLMQRSEDPQQAPTPRTYDDLRANSTYWGTEQRCVCIKLRDFEKLSKEGTVYESRDFLCEVKGSTFGQMLLGNGGEVIASLPAALKPLAENPMLAAVAGYEAEFEDGYGPKDVLAEAYRAKIAKGKPWPPHYKHYCNGNVVSANEVLDKQYLRPMTSAQSVDDEQNADSDGSVHMTEDDSVLGSNPGSGDESGVDGSPSPKRRNPLSDITPNSTPAKRGRKGPRVASDTEQDSDSPSDDESPARHQASAVTTAIDAEPLIV